MHDSTANRGDVTEQPEKIWNATFISVFITNMLMYLGQQLSNTIIAKYTYSLGATTALVGFVTSLFAVTALIFKLFSAPALDTFNRKFILCGAMIVISAAFAGFGVSKSVPMLITFRLLQGVGQAFTTTGCLALATDSLPQDKLGAGIGYFSLAQAACQALGPTIGLKLTAMFGYQITFAAGACIMLIGAFSATRVKIKHVRGKKFHISLDSLLVREAVLPAVIAFFLVMTYCIINSFLVIYAEEKGIGSDVGYFFTVYAVALLFSRPLTGRLADKYGHVKVLIPAMLCFAASFLIISAASNIWIFLLAALVSAFGYGACLPAVQALCMKRVPPDKRGAGSCTNYIGQDLGQLAGPTLAGFIAGIFGYERMWQVMIIPIGIAMLIVILFRKSIENGHMVS